MIAIRARLDDRSMRDALRRMRRKGKRLDPVLRELRGTLREELLTSARAEESPEGEKWPARAAGSKQRYKRSGKRTKRGRLRVGRKRRLLGRLPQATEFRVLRGALVARSKVPWAAAHQYGAQVGRGSILPARKFIDIPEKFAEHAAKRIMDYVILEEWGR